MRQYITILHASFSYFTAGVIILFFQSLFPLLGQPSNIDSDGPLIAISNQDILFLEQITQAVIDSSKIYPGESLPGKVSGFGPNNTGITLIRPGGRNAYPAFWVRDYAMSLESGMFTTQEQKDLLIFTSERQADQTLLSASGSIIPYGSIPDHITLRDGLPIYFPGTVDGYLTQGDRLWKMPPFGDQCFFIHMAWYYYEKSGDTSILMETINGKTLIDRLELAFRVIPASFEDPLVVNNEDFLTTDFGFRDVVTMTGKLCFGSLLKYRAALELSELFALIDMQEKAEVYRKIAIEIKELIPEVFADDRGLLKASTGMSSQPDVWATAFAIYIGALNGEAELKASQTLAKAYHEGTLALEGQIRHVLTTDDFDAFTAWQKAGARKNRYQNGAYWGTPTGWVCYAISLTDTKTASKLAGEYIRYLRKADFRQGADFGGPYECIYPPDNYEQNPVYMTSVSCPYAAFMKMGVQVMKKIR